MQAIATDKMGKWLHHLSGGMEKNNFGKSSGEMAVYKESDGPGLDDYWSDAEDSDSSRLCAKHKALIIGGRT
jgi:hypothetical protein